MLLSTLAFHSRLAAAGFSSPGAGARLEAGRVVEVRWEALPRGIEEMELLVSLDGRQGFARVADRLDPAAVSYSWLVTSLPTEHAVLAIRGRIDGRETLLLESDGFAIERAAGVDLQPLSYHGDELWTDTSGSSTPVTDPGVADPRRTTLASGAEDEPEESSSILDRIAPPDSTGQSAAPSRHSAPALQSSRSQSPLAFPRRN